jgi:methyl-accepting chemotaxis protein
MAGRRTYGRATNVSAMDPRETDDAIEIAAEHTERAERDLRDALDAESATVDEHAESVAVAADDLHELAADAREEAERADEPRPD